MTGPDHGITRKVLLERAALGAGALATAGAIRPIAASGASGVVPLPSAAQVLADNQRMVDFGSRLTGAPGHASVHGLAGGRVRQGRAQRCCPATTTTTSAGPSGASASTSSTAPPPGQGQDRLLVHALAGDPGSRAHRAARLWRRAAPAQHERDGLRRAAGRDRALPRRAGAPGPAPAEPRRLACEGSILVVDLPVPLPITTAARSSGSRPTCTGRATPRPTGCSSTTSAHGSCPASACRWRRSRGSAPRAWCSSSTPRWRGAARQLPAVRPRL